MIESQAGDEDRRSRGCANQEVQVVAERKPQSSELSFQDRRLTVATSSWQGSGHFPDRVQINSPFFPIDELILPRPIHWHPAAFHETGPVSKMMTRIISESE
jgi:hypothetical protein